MFPVAEISGKILSSQEVDHFLYSRNLFFLRKNKGVRVYAHPCILLYLFLATAMGILVTETFGHISMFYNNIYVLVINV